MDDFLKALILEKAQASQILKIELIQELWSGYGQLSRLTLNNKSVILKLIQFPKNSSHPRGWNSQFSHERKKKSYQVETHWYQNSANPISGARTAQLIASGRQENYSYLILEDLRNSNFLPKASINKEERQRCLSWLAHFHRTNLAKEPDGLWKIGTYWHLETRPQELEALKDEDLKKAAPLIDQKLNRAKFQTLVHGDAKLSNFLFNESEAAAVDFQYIGGGIGLKDVAYFLSSIFQEEELGRYEKECLEYYFKKLNLPEVEEEWRELYSFVWCDFYRFLLGWSPGHYKINSYSLKMKESVISSLEL